MNRLAARIVAVPVLRAGLGMLDAFLELVPQAQVGYFGLERDETTAVARRYYEKVPKDLAGAVVFLLDPMLATGGSAAMAIEGSRRLGARSVRLLSIVAAPEGLALLRTAVAGRHGLHREHRPRAERPEVHPARARATSATGCSEPDSEGGYAPFPGHPGAVLARRSNRATPPGADGPRG